MKRLTPHFMVVGLSTVADGWRKLVHNLSDVRLAILVALGLIGLGFGLSRGAEQLFGRGSRVDANEAAIMANRNESRKADATILDSLHRVAKSQAETNREVRQELRENGRDRRRIEAKIDAALGLLVYQSCRAYQPKPKACDAEALKDIRQRFSQGGT